jgi:outer membrane protein
LKQWWRKATNYSTKELRKKDNKRMNSLYIFERKKWLFSIVTLIMLFSSSRTFSQEIETLSLEKAIEIALEKNYGIQLAKQQVDVVEYQIYKGNAGLTPTVDWNVNVGGSLNQVNQKLSNGNEINRFGQGTTPNSNVSLAWTLYDGRRMQTNYELLKSRSQLEVAQSKLTIQNTVEAVMQTYYEILRQKKSVEFLQTIIRYYDERLNLTQQRWEIGRGSKLDYLQSKTDLTAQQTLLVQVKNQLENAKIRLNTLLNRPTTERIDVVEKEELARNYNLSELVSQAKAKNQDLAILQRNLELNLLNEKIAESFRKPRIALNSAFGYSLNKSNAGLFLLNQNVGLSATVSATWNIFNGQQTRRDIETAKLNTAIIETQKKSTLQNIENELITSYNQFVTDQELLRIEEENKAIAEENLTISLEKFRLGGSTILELNEAQRRFDTSLNRLVNSLYNVKISELDLLRLSGELLR